MRGGVMGAVAAADVQEGGVGGWRVTTACVWHVVHPKLWACKTTGCNAVHTCYRFSCY